MPPKMRLVLKFFGYLLPVLLLTTALTSANSNTVTFTGGYNSDPNSYYGIGPYTGTLGSQSELFYCVDFSHDITSGQSWNVTITGLPSTNFSTTRLGAVLEPRTSKWRGSRHNLSLPRLDQPRQRPTSGRSGPCRRDRFRFLPLMTGLPDRSLFRSSTQRPEPPLRVDTTAVDGKS